MFIGKGRQPFPVEQVQAGLGFHQDIHAGFGVGYNHIATAAAGDRGRQDRAQCLEQVDERLFQQQAALHVDDGMAGAAIEANQGFALAAEKGKGGAATAAGGNAHQRCDLSIPQVMAGQLRHQQVTLPRFIGGVVHVLKGTAAAPGKMGAGRFGASWSGAQHFHQGGNKAIAALAFDAGQHPISRDRERHENGIVTQAGGSVAARANIVDFQFNGADWHCCPRFAARRVGPGTPGHRRPPDKFKGNMAGRMQLVRGNVQAGRTL